MSSFRSEDFGGARGGSSSFSSLAASVARGELSRRRYFIERRPVDLAMVSRKTSSSGLGLLVFLQLSLLRRPRSTSSSTSSCIFLKSFRALTWLAFLFLDHTVTPRTLPTLTNRLNLTGRAAPAPFPSLQAFLEAHTPPTYIVRNLAAMGISEMSEVGRGAAAVMMAVSLGPFCLLSPPPFASLTPSSLPLPPFPTRLLSPGSRSRCSRSYRIRKDPLLPPSSPHPPSSTRFGIDREVRRASSSPPRADEGVGSADPE